MKTYNDLLDDILFDNDIKYDFTPRIKGMPQSRNIFQKTKKPLTKKRQETELYDQSDILQEYDFTYKASRHEEGWLLDSLGSFFEEQWFDDVLKIVKGGKEASVYLCQANVSIDRNLLAAKVFRPRSLRNLRKDHLYREGRSRLDEDGLTILDERQYRAMRKKTSYGQNLMHTSWIEHEFKTLKLLHSAGCNVPTPHASDHNAILMDFIGDEQVNAPTLKSIHLDKSERQRLFDQIIHNVQLMLKNERVHGDLSAYNILYWDKGITLIDFPQTINPTRNPNAYAIFQRDIKRICEYFDSQGLHNDHSKLAESLWVTHGYNTIPNFLWTGTEEDQEPEENFLY
jgi:RIO kinase 1